MIKRGLIVAHRWLGVALSINFFVWFVSGIGMMYWEFPSVSAADRLLRSPSLDPHSITTSVADAFAAANLESADEVHITSFDGRPVYRLRSGRSTRVVYADSAELRQALSREQVDRLAAAWSGQPVAAASVRSLDDVDQWTVQLPLARLKPVWQYAWPDGQQVYVSQASGEVVQYTTSRSRLGAYVGAIPHWIYVTPLRKHGPMWSRIVIALSSMGTIVAALGLTIGVWTFSPSRRYRHGPVPVRIPYRGWKRWHAILGLIAGSAALTWVFSGLLSMDPIDLPGDPRHTDAVVETLRAPIRHDAFARVSPREALAAIGGSPVRQLELVFFDGQPVYAATLESGEMRLVDSTARVTGAFDIRDIQRLTASAVQPDHIADARLLTRYDRYYLDRHLRKPLPVVLVQVRDAERSRFYVDPKSAQLVGAYSAKNWVTRWLYHGLHSLDFPWLYQYRPLWDIVVGAFMIAGSALCFTSLVLAWRVIGRTLAP